MTLEELRQYKPQILALAEQYGVENIRVFGSVARGDADEDSDVDLMIHTTEKCKGFDFITFKQSLEGLLKRSVDLVEVEFVKNRLRKKYMLEDVVPL